MCPPFSEEIITSQTCLQHLCNYITSKHWSLKVWDVVVVSMRDLKIRLGPNRFYQKYKYNLVARSFSTSSKQFSSIEMLTFDLQQSFSYPH